MGEGPSDLEEVSRLLLRRARSSVTEPSRPVKAALLLAVMLLAFPSSGAAQATVRRELTQPMSVDSATQRVLRAVALPDHWRVGDPAAR